eukprot:scaffold22681_cov146-Cylindrotheca_fusiformis.AAC.5
MAKKGGVPRLQGATMTNHPLQARLYYNTKEGTGDKLLCATDMVSSVEADPTTRTEETIIPLIDLEQQRQEEVVGQIAQACESVGFFLIQNHGVPTSISDHAWKVSRLFFDAPIEQKLEFQTSNEEEYPYGYEQTEQLAKGKKIDGYDNDNDDDDGQNAAAAAADLKETFAIGPDNEESGMPFRRWKQLEGIPPTFQEGLEEYYSHMERLANKLLKLFALALKQKEEFFESRMDHHMSALRLVHYYPLDSTTKFQQQQQQGIIRAAAHTDYGALTILNSQTPGLEVFVKHRWYPVPVVPGTFIINLGDLMQRWTNDKWVSTLHRVSMPATTAMERRYSMAYFVNINGDSLVEPLDSCTDSNNNEEEERSKRYPPILARDHLMAKHLASMSNPK